LQEIWKDIDGYEGSYQVSNTGKVRSLDRKVHNYIKTGRVLKAKNNGHGYLDVSLSGKTKQKHAYIHILVAKAFIPNPNSYEQVNHKDFNKANNCVDNLEWVSRKQNLLHYRQSKLYKRSQEKRMVKAHKKYVEQVLKYKDKVIGLYDEGLSVKNVSKQIDIGRDMVGDILKLYGKL